MCFIRGLALEQIHTSESDFQISANLLDFRVSVSVSDFGFYLDRTYCDVWPLAIYVGKTAESRKDSVKLAYRMPLYEQLRFERCVREELYLRIAKSRFWP